MNDSKPLYLTKMAQVEYEIEALCGIIESEECLSLLEIGSQYGGSLYRLAKALPLGSRIVSVDKPHADHQTAKPLQECITYLNSVGYDARLFFGDSTSSEIVTKVTELGPFDAVFIDGNHSLPYVTKDWQNYGSLGSLVAFHDIAWDRPVRPGRVPIEVAKLWREIKAPYKHREIIAPGSEKGIGVIWRDAI